MDGLFEQVDDVLHRVGLPGVDEISVRRVQASPLRDPFSVHENRVHRQLRRGQIRVLPEVVRHVELQFGDLDRITDRARPVGLAIRHVQSARRIFMNASSFAAPRPRSGTRVLPSQQSGKCTEI